MPVTSFKMDYMYWCRNGVYQWINQNIDKQFFEIIHHDLTPYGGILMAEYRTVEIKIMGEENILAFKLRWS